MPRDAREIASGLERKGFRRRKGDHVFFHLFVGEKKTLIYTKISHGRAEIDDRLLGLMAKQVKLAKRQFFELVDCPLTAEEYLRLLRAGGHIS